MRAVWLENRRLELREVPTPVATEGEVRVRVLQAGICNTDLELVRGYYPFAGIPGHEFVGVVADPSSPMHGRRVVGEINAVCGRCAACEAGRESHCTRRTVLGIVNRNGAFAETLVLPRGNLHAVPDGVSDDAATFVEPLAAALRIQEQIEIRAEHRVLVVGTGKLGQLIARSLALTGCRLAALGRNPETVGLLAACGVETRTADDMEDAAYDVAIECTGNEAGFDLALRAVRPAGTLILKSTYAGNLQLDAARIVVDEVRVIGSRCGPFAPALELLSTGRVDVEPLIAARYPLQEALAAFEHAGRPGCLKVVVRAG